MTTVTLVMILIALINVFVLFINISLFKDLITIKLLITQMHTGLGMVANKLQTQENYLHKLGNAFSEFTELMDGVAEKLSMAFNPKTGMMYKTMDGKYAASSLEELLDKISKDGEESNYLSKDEIDNLRRLFEEDDEDDDDDFNPNEDQFK